MRKTTDNLEAYDAYLRGVEYYYRFTKEDNLQARELFERAIALDPPYAEAYSTRVHLLPGMGVALESGPPSAGAGASARTPRDRLR